MKTRTLEKPLLSDTKIDKMVGILEGIYMVFICILIPYLFFFVIDLIAEETISGRQRNTMLTGFLALSIYVAIYKGLKKKKKWVIPLVLISSAFALIRTLIDLIVPAQDVTAIIGKLVGIIYLFFIIYQLSFFSKREVKNYFNDEGVVFFQ